MLARQLVVSIDGVASDTSVQTTKIDYVPRYFTVASLPVSIICAIELLSWCMQLLAGSLRPPSSPTMSCESSGAAAIQVLSLLCAYCLIGWRCRSVYSVHPNSSALSVYQLKQMGKRNSTAMKAVCLTVLAGLAAHHGKQRLAVWTMPRH